MIDNTAFMVALLPRLPLFIAYVVGLALAASYARSLGRAGLMAAIGFGLLLVSWLTGAAFQYWAMTIARNMRSPDIAFVLGLLTLLREATDVAGIVFLMLAIFSRRTNAATPAGR